MLFRFRLLAAGMLVAVTSLGRDALAAPSIGPENPVPTPQRMPLATTEPTAAFDGENFLVVWYGGVGAVFGARVRASDGTLLDQAAFTIAQAPSPAPWIPTAPSVAFDGTNFVVVWSQGPAGGNGEVHGARVTPGGVLLDGPAEAGGFPIATSSSLGESQPRVAFDGTNYFVAWNESSATSSVLGARVSPAGVRLDGAVDAPGTPIATAPSSTLGDVAFDGTNTLVVWETALGTASPHVFGARVSPAGVLLDGPPETGGIPIATAPGGSQSAPRVGCAGATGCLVAWNDGGSAARARLVQGSTLLDGPATTDGVEVAGGDVVPVGVASDGARFAVLVATAPQSPEIVPYALVPVAGDGTASPAVSLGVGGGPSTSPYPEGAVTFGGGDYLALWYPEGDVASTTVSRVSASDLTLLDATGIGVSWGLDSQDAPVLAWGGSSYVATWLDLATTYGDPYSAVLDPTGAPRGGSAPVLAGTNPVQIRSVGAGYLGVGNAFAQNCVFALDATGQRTGGRQSCTVVGASTTAAASLPTLASSGCEALVLWQEWNDPNPETGGPPPQNYAERVGPDEQLLDPGPLSLGPGDVVSGVSSSPMPPAPYPVVVAAFDGTNYLVVRTGLVGHTGSTPAIWGQRVSMSGKLLDPVQVELALGSSPTLSFDGSNYLLAWISNSGGAVAAAIVDPRTLSRYDGDPSSPGTILATGGALATQISAPSLASAFDGANYVVVWAQLPDGTASQNFDVRAARVGVDGTLLDGPATQVGFEVAAGTAVDAPPSVQVASDGQSHTLIAYPRIADPVTGAMRVFTRLVTDDIPSTARLDGGVDGGGPVQVCPPDAGVGSDDGGTGDDAGGDNGASTPAGASGGCEAGASEPADASGWLLALAVAAGMVLARKRRPTLS